MKRMLVNAVLRQYCHYLLEVGNYNATALERVKSSPGDTNKPLYNVTETPLMRNSLQCKYC